MIGAVGANDADDVSDVLCARGYVNGMQKYSFHEYWILGYRSDISGPESIGIEVAIHRQETADMGTGTSSGDENEG